MIEATKRAAVAPLAGETQPIRAGDRVRRKTGGRTGTVLSIYREAFNYRNRGGRLKAEVRWERGRSARTHTSRLLLAALIPAEEAKP